MDQRAELTSTITITVADLAGLLLLSVVLARLAGRFRQPVVVAELIAGVLLGPTALGLLPGHLVGRVFPADCRMILSCVSQIGIALFMFLIGWELDPRPAGGSRRMLLGIATSSMAVPFVLGAGLALVLYGDHDRVAGHQVDFTAFVLYMGVAVSITAFPVLARFLADAGLTMSKVGRIALSAAAAGDGVAWALLAVVVSIATTTGEGLLVRSAQLVAFVLVMILVVRPLLARLWRRWQRDGGSAHAAIITCAGILASAAATSWIGIHALFGAFAFGCVMPRGLPRPLVTAVREPVDQMSRLFLPVFFIVVGLSVNLTDLGYGGLVELALVVMVASVGKVVGAGAPGRLAGLSRRQAGVLGALMNMRGLTELIVLQIGMSLHILDRRIGGVPVAAALITTAATGVLVRPERATPPVKELAGSGRAG